MLYNDFAVLIVFFSTVVWTMPLRACRYWRQSMWPSR